MSLSSDVYFLLKIKTGRARNTDLLQLISNIDGVEAVTHAPEIQELKNRLEKLESIFYGLQQVMMEFEKL